MRMLYLFGVLLFAAVLTSPAQARKQITVAHHECNIFMPCEGVAPSARGQRVVEAMGGFGSARPVYERRSEVTHGRGPNTLLAHPSGCPSRLFCGCGAAVRVFGNPIRSLWAAASWFKFPRTAPAPGAVAVRRHHVFVLEAHLGGNIWQVYDANSGRQRTRIHARSISGYTIVNPKA
jgi:hypothetical protein